MKKILKKGIAGVIATGVLAIPIASSAFAAEQNSEKSEVVYENDQLRASNTYDNTNNISSFATSGEMDGGYWIRGKSGSNVLSNYKHYTKQGFASVTNGEGKYKDGGWKPKNVQSVATLPWTSKGTNKANYDFK